MTAELLTSDQLLAGFSESDPTSFVRTWDFQRFQCFVAAGGASPTTLEDARDQAQWDAEMSFSLKQYITSTSPKVLGIMGGHGISRSEATYPVIAKLSRQLTQAGYFIVTGGGPGAMEAGHLGAAFANSTDGAFNRALQELAASGGSVPSGSMVDPKTGQILPGHEAQIAAAHAWLLGAVRAKALLDGEMGKSLAIPTWLYGQEPTTPLASSYAKYYQNSIREETLISNGRVGILYAKGGGGTLREIFQDVEINYYVQKHENFIPMLFVDPLGFWQTEANYDAQGQTTTPGIKVDEVLKEAFRYALGAQLFSQCEYKLRFTTDFEEIRAVLDVHAPVAAEAMRLMTTGAASVLMRLRRR